MKYLLFAFLAAFLPSCAPKAVTAPDKSVIFNKIEGKYGRKEVVMLNYGFSGAGHTVIVHGSTYKSMLREETAGEIVEFLNGFSPKG